MVDVRIYSELRRLLDEGFTIEKAYSHLLKKEYSGEEIRLAIDEYFKDENTEYDDKLIEEIEKRFKKKELLHEILSDLVLKGNNPIEVEKAFYRARLENKKIAMHFKVINFHHALQIILAFVTLFLGIFYDKTFFLVTIFYCLTVVMFYAFGPTHEDKMEWKSRMFPSGTVSPTPFAGPFWIDGYWAFNFRTGRYFFRWWMVSPKLLFPSFFFLLGIMFYFTHGSGGFLICFFLSLYSLLAFQNIDEIF
jgi:hypothetical protein